METIPDHRHIANGYEIPSETYCDQPYIVQTDDGAWLCVMTTGSGHEGHPGQHVVTLRSTDQGRTWSQPVPLEPADGPEASYAVLLKVPGGRIYAFYNHNTDNIRQVKAEEVAADWAPDGWCRRVDSLGYFVFKYSDDGGRTWSPQRYPIPVREMAIDRENVYGGAIRFFWNVGRPFIHDGAAYVSLHKVGGFGRGFFTRSEGVLLKSENILTERDPERITWETLPDGDHGLRAPAGGGPIAEEQSYSVLSDGTFFCVYRTIDGHPAYAYSRDQGHTWTEPQYLRYANGRLVKHPRAANFAWRCQNGHFLYWFHNHGGTWYEDRNPVWLCGGVEVDGPDGKEIRWSQPEIALYDDDPFIRMSYPDLVEEDGRYFVTETQKDIARVHELDPTLLADLWGQFKRATVARDGLLLEQGSPMPDRVEAPPLPVFVRRSASRADHGTEDLRAGFTVELWIQLDSLAAGQILLDNRTRNGKGFCLQTTARGTVEMVLNDGRTENRWDCDPGLLSPGSRHHLVAIVDGGPKIVSFVVDGVLCDGGKFRQFGWGRFSPHLRELNGEVHLRIGPKLQGRIHLVRLYGRYLRTSEAIGNYRAGL
ncbi:hypothetical protein FKZ61_002365 [Litorilinea aerophila]|uniref:Sialidase domain-containing protein n=1 Tax=Litorilinea aerophila TaxID=1204385 RepID=A0A540VLV3_9CHLR|nr:LamG-like jellyroll fold domain-containing protein [Litorilinea aerophila]MCC9074961.1 hypothetical protein [Litorilinea aerophila]